jgi:hypothetical protein
MADFRLEFSGGVTLEPWSDPADILGDLPSRLNARPEHEHTRHVAVSGVQVELRARVAGVLAPLDGALGGALFTAAFLELPSFPPPAFSSPVGQSSVQRVTLVTLGHYTLSIAREGHGAVIVHVDVDS